MIAAEVAAVRAEMAAELADANVARAKVEERLAQVEAALKNSTSGPGRPKSESDVTGVPPCIAAAARLEDGLRADEQDGANGAHEGVCSGGTESGGDGGGGDDGGDEPAAHGDGGADESTPSSAQSPSSVPGSPPARVPIPAIQSAESVSASLAGSGDVRQRRPSRFLASTNVGALVEGGEPKPIVRMAGLRSGLVLFSVAPIVPILISSLWFDNAAAHLMLWVYSPIFCLCIGFHYMVTVELSEQPGLAEHSHMGAFIISYTIGVAPFWFQKIGVWAGVAVGLWIALFAPLGFFIFTKVRASVRRYQVRKGTLGEFVDSTFLFFLVTCQKVDLFLKGEV